MMGCDLFVHGDIVRRIDPTNPEKGHGFFATRSIARGTVILAETPLLAPSSRPGSTQKNMMALIRLGMDVCPAAFMKLAPRSSDDLVLKFKRNAFNFAGYPALLFHGAVFNHSCKANVHFAPNNMKTQMIFTTTRDIEVGEELCDSYTTQCKSTEVAHSRLKSQYGFVCCCALR